MAQNSNSLLPHLVEGVDLRALPIGPAEAYVLSQVDGLASVREIAESAGLEPETVGAALEKLAQFGAVQFREREQAGSHRTPRPAARPSGALRGGAAIEATPTAEPHHPAAALYDPRELDEEIDLDELRKRKILEAYYRLDTSTHYELLQVQPSADKRVIKNAYYEVVKVFHPDRYFGKNLGSFKAKLDRLFARLTEAHDVLTRGATRAEYDDYLSSRRKTSDLDQSGADPALRAHIQAIQRQIEAEASAALARADSSPAARRDSPAPSLPPTSAQRRPSLGPLDADSRKRALARKLGGSARTFSGSMPAVQMPSLAPAPAPDRTESDRAADELKRRYEQRLLQARVQRAESLLESAQAALTSKDVVAAANALRIAASLVPENAQLNSRIQQAQDEADALLSAHYLAQAEYEEREGRLAEAARSYARASSGNSTARIFERAAYCGLMAEADLRLASEHARRALSLVAAGAGEEAQCRVTLARIYVAAGMKQSALAEFERAATLAPNDDTIPNWIRRLKRGEA